MTDNYHIWEPGKEPPILQKHSQAKHHVISSYLRRYVEVLTTNIGIPKLKLTLVDGFSGGGRFRDSKNNELLSGTPLLMLEAMRDAYKIAQSKRDKLFELFASYYFIEKDKAAFDYLTSTINNSEFRSLNGKEVALINDDFTNYLPTIINELESKSKNIRAIFLLDQSGYTDAPMPQIRNIFSRLNKAEVILFFPTDSLINYLSTDDNTQKVLSKIGINIPPEIILSIKTHRDWRHAIQLILHKEIHSNSGAKYYTPFFVRSQKANRDYWLIHLSNEARARDVMVAEHWSQNTSFVHYGKPGLKMLGYDSEEDFNLTGQKVLPSFNFDESALSLTENALFSEFPGLISQYKSGINFKELFASITNECPGTSDHMKKVLKKLKRNSDVGIRDKHGKIKSIISAHTDVIIPSQYKKRLFIRDGFIK